MSLLMVEEEEHNKQQMEAQEGDPVATSTPSNINNVSILKGKRTKRQRPQSPLPFTVAAANSSSNNAGGDYVNSTTTSDEESAGPVATEEEEDMAKCLLLLSQGGPKYDTHFGTVPYKFTSKKYLETSTTSNGKTGIYVYQCKTCNRTFPSFQALGGHRASHRKPKNVSAAVLENKPRLIISDEDEDHSQQQPPPPQFKRSFSASSLSLQLTTRPNIPFNNTDYNKYSPKVHECAICGTEFSSGQALGGHMRRHRGGAPVNRSNATTTTTNANTKTLPLLPFCPNPISAIDPIDYHQETKKLKTCSVNLSLDLNLPAATEDESKQHKQNLESPAYSFSSSQQQQQQQQQQKQSSLVLSAAPTLVDCQH